MCSIYARLLNLLLLTTTTGMVFGCRAIGRFGDSRQTIAARRLSGQGFQAMHDGRWDIAETLFTDALQVSKSDDRAHWGLAESFWERGERERAVAQMEQAVRLSAADPRMVQRLGRMYLELGRPEEADEHSLWALQLQRDSAEVWALRGDCLRAGGQDDEALAAYHRALALQPDFPDVQLHAAEIYGAERRFDRVLATLDRLQDGIGADDARPQVDMLKGIAMRQLGRTDEACRSFASAAAKAPDDASPHLEIAAIELQRGNINEAQDALSIAMRLDPDTRTERQWLAQLQSQHQQLAAQSGVGGDQSPQRR